MRNFLRKIEKNKLNGIELDPITLGTGTITTLTSTTGNITTAHITTADATTVNVSGLATVATGLFHVLRIPTAAHNVSGSFWVSGAGDYFFIRARGTTKSGALV